jgi:hypothetical protein
MLSKWDERPQDVSNLLNPPFLGMLLYRAVRGFKKEATAGMPFELIVLVLSFVLHGATRNRLPTKITTSLPTWIQLNRDALLEFAKRTQALLPFTKEAISFLAERGVLVFDDSGRIDVGSGRLATVTQHQHSSDEIAACYKRADFVGRWLALAGSPTTVFMLLGIRP